MSQVPASGLGIAHLTRRPFYLYSTLLSPLHHPFFLSYFHFSRICSAARISSKMRWCLALLLCCFLAAVNALSSSGSRLLVVLDDSTEKSSFSTLWSDLEGNWMFSNGHGLR